MSNYSKWSPIALMKEKGQWPPYPLDSEDWFKFLKEQKHILREGYTVGGDRISPEQYCFLNLCHIGIGNSDGSKIPTLPFYSDASREFFDTYEDIKGTATKPGTGENLLGLKTRDKGWTYQVAAIAVYRTHFVDFSETVALFPGGKSFPKDNFTKAYSMAENNMISEFRWPHLKESLQGKYIAQIKYGVEIEELDRITRQPTGIKKTCGPQSVLTNMIVTDPSVVRSGRAQLIIIEELGEMGIEGNRWNTKDVIGVAMGVLKEGSRKLGPIIAGGTSNQFGFGFPAFKDLWLNPQQYNFRKIWIPSNKFHLPFINYETGESDLEGAKADILKDRETKKGRDLLIHKQEHALTEDEALFEGINSVFDVTKCNKQISYILASEKIKNSIQTGRFYPVKMGGGKLGATFNIETNGPWQIFKHPDKSLKYPIVAGMDSYYIGKANQSDSEGAIEHYVPFQGVNVPGEYPAAIYRGRPDDKDDFFMQALLSAIYYDDEILFEYTEEDFIKFMTLHNSLKHLKERPRIIKNKNRDSRTVDDYKYGVKPSNKPMAIEHSVKIFNAHYDEIFFVDLLREMIKFGDVNTDRVDAHNWAVLHAMDNQEMYDEFRKPKPEPKFQPMFVRDDNGRGQYVKTKEQAQKMGLIPGPAAQIHDKIKLFIQGKQKK